MRQNFTAARDAFLEAYDVLRPLRQPEHPQFIESQTTQYMVVGNLGQVYQDLEQMDHALALKYEALEIACRNDELLTVARAHFNIAEALVLMERVTEARSHLEQTICGCREVGATTLEIEARSQLTALARPLA